MRLLLAANNQATRRNEIIKSYLQMGSSSNRYAPRLPQQETKSSTKELPPTDPILAPENLLKTSFVQKGLSSCPSGRHKPQSWNRLAVPFLGPHTPLNKKRKALSRSHFLDSLAVPKMRPQIPKSTAKADQCNEQKMTTAFVNASTAGF